MRVVHTSSYGITPPCAALFFGMLIILRATLGIAPTPLPIGSPALTCGVYKITYEYAQKIQPTLGEAQSKAIWDALQLDACNETWALPKPTATVSASEAQLPKLRLFVDAYHGDDANDGSEVQPLNSLEAAVARTRVLRSPGQSATIVLREGAHVLRSTLHLGAAYSGLTITGY